MLSLLSVENTWLCAVNPKNRVFNVNALHEPGVLLCWFYQPVVPKNSATLSFKPTKACQKTVRFFAVSTTHTYRKCMSICIHTYIGTTGAGDNRPARITDTHSGGFDDDLAIAWSYCFTMLL